MSQLVYKPKPKDLYLNNSEISKALQLGEAQFRKLIAGWNLDDLPDQQTKMLQALKGISTDLRSSTSEKAILDISTAFCYSNNEVATAVYTDICSRWSKQEEPTPFTASIKILTAPSENNLGLYVFGIDLFPVKENQVGVLYPDVFNLGLTSVDKTMFLSFLAAWDLTGLGEKFSGRWRIENVHDNELSKDASPSPYRIGGKSKSQGINFTHEANGNQELAGFTDDQPGESPDEKLSGSSAQAAALCAMLAASGDCYREGLPAQQGNGIDPSIALSATVTDEIDQSVDVSAPQNQVTSKTDDILLRKLGKVDYKFEKLNGAVMYGLSTVYFSKPQAKQQQQAPDKASRSINEIREKQKKEGYLGLVVLDVGTVLEALDGILLTNRFQRTYQEKIKQYWLQQWEPGTADFDSMNRSGKTSNNSSETA